MRLYTRRRLINRINLTASVLTTLFGLFWLAWLLFTLFARGFQYLDLGVFTQATPPPGSAGGLANAIVGTLILTGVGVLIGAPVGVLAGTWLNEFGRSTRASARIAAVVRFVNELLLSAPSIIIGVFIYTIVVLHTGHFSGWAGTLALATIVIPVVVSTTENMLRLVPDSLREAAAALGAPKWQVVTMVVWRSASTGIITGILLAIARISGETAPLLFTALSSQFWSTDMTQPMANLPVVIFHFAMSPYEDWQHLAWAGALIITISVLVLNVGARALLHLRMKRA